MLTSNIIDKSLKGIKVFLSASFPDELINTPQAQDLYSAIVVLVKKILKEGGGLICGGHPSITPLIHQAAISMNIEIELVEIYQLNHFRSRAPKQIKDETVFDVHWVGTQDKSNFDINNELGNMREQMCSLAQAAIFVGGKKINSLTKTKGIREEYEYFLNKHPKGPVYLLGFLEGETFNIIEEIKKKGVKELNGLSNKENDLIHNSENIDLITGIIASDISKKLRGKIRSNIYA